MAQDLEKAAPKAPKDPRKKSEGFYVMRGKDVFGNPQPDGRGIQFIYENDNRLINSSRLIGNISDENMLSLMKTTEGFRKLVHSIGVCVEVEDDLSGDALFVFQMYGNKDPYNSGTSIRLSVKTDGSEHMVFMEDVEWSDDDNEPGQIRFEFPKAEVLAKVSVKFYLNDGFTAPPIEEDNEVDFSSPAYKEMISKSLDYKGNTKRIKKVIEKARRGEDTTIAFIGGSITQGAGAIPINKKCYSYFTFEKFCSLVGKSTKENVHYVKAGVGGTPSELGMIRYDRDVCRDGKVTPDLVVVEFAVNDAGDETNGKCYESLIRKIYNSPQKPAVIMLFAVFQDDYNLQERLAPIGRHLHVPTVNLKSAVTPQFYKKAGEGRIVSKNQYFYDQYHPTNTGHMVMADCLLNLLEMVDGEEEEKEDFSFDEVSAYYGKEFENIHLIDRKDNAFDAAISEGDFKDTDKALQFVEMDMNLVGTPEFPNNWMHVPGGDKPFVMDIECKALLIVYMDSADIAVGKAEVFADGEKKLTIDPRIIGWGHCNPYIVINEEKTKMHHVEVKMCAEDIDKRFTILGFGIVK